jgi:hypothetical protein
VVLSLELEREVGMRLLPATVGAALFGLALFSRGDAQPKNEPPVTLATLLPGPVELIGHNDSVVYFIDPARLQKVDQTVTVRVYEVYSPHFAGFHESLQSVSDWVVDCRTMVRRTLPGQVFGEAGVFKFPADPQDPEHLKVGGAWDNVAEAACGHAAPPHLPSVTVGPALVRFSQALLSAPPELPTSKPAGVRLIAWPSAADLAAVMAGWRPPEGVTPTVALLCVGGADGALAACAASEEHPTGSGFAAAELKLIGKFRVESSDRGGGSTEGAVIALAIVLAPGGVLAHAAEVNGS